MKQLLLAALVSGMTFGAFAQTAPATKQNDQPAAMGNGPGNMKPGSTKPGPTMHRAPLNAEQKECLQKELGKPGQGQPPPTREKFEAAFKTCKLAPPPAHPGMPAGAEKRGAAPAKAH